MNTNLSIQITGALRAADLVGSRSVISLPSHAPAPRNVGWPEPTNDHDWEDLERRMAAREAARSLHPAGRGLSEPGRAA
jgi:hypothetical protein